MKSFKTTYQGEEVEVTYSGSGSEIVIRSIVNVIGKELPLPFFASFESVALYASAANYDYDRVSSELDQHALKWQVL